MTGARLDVISLVVTEGVIIRAVDHENLIIFTIVNDKSAVLIGDISNRGTVGVAGGVLEDVAEDVTEASQRVGAGGGARVTRSQAGWRSWEKVRSSE